MMTLLTILAMPVVLILLAILIGLRLPKTHVAASRIRLNASPEEIWAIITDFASHPSWRPGLERVELGPEMDGNPTWFEVCANNIRVQFARVESDPPKRMTTRMVGEKLPLSGTWNYELTEEGGNTLVTITENDYIYHPLFRFFSKFVISYHGTMDVFLTALALRLGEDVHPEHLKLKQGEPARIE